jgi:hypothetical protein
MHLFVFGFTASTIYRQMASKSRFDIIVIGAGEQKRIY